MGRTCRLHRTSPVNYQTFILVEICSVVQKRFWVQIHTGTFLCGPVWVLWLPSIVQRVLVRLIGDSALAEGVSVNGYLPATDWQALQGVPTTAGICASPPWPWIGWVDENGWKLKYICKPDYTGKLKKEEVCNLDCDTVLLYNNLNGNIVVICQIRVKVRYHYMLKNQTRHVNTTQTSLNVKLISLQLNLCKLM